MFTAIQNNGKDHRRLASSSNWVGGQQGDGRRSSM